MSRRFRGSVHAPIVGLAAVVLSVVAPVQPALASDITVETTADQFGSGRLCAFREAIEAANRNAAFGGCRAGSRSDVILLPRGIFTLTRGADGEDANAEGDVDITQDLEIRGAGRGRSIIDGNANDRAIQVIGPVDTSFAGLTIRNGAAPFQAGGGISATDPGSRLTLSRVDLVDNNASSGGGIFTPGVATLTRVTARDNSADNSGGGLFFDGPQTTVTRVKVHDNSAQNSGGGIALTDGNGLFTRVSASGNTAGNQGAAMVVTNSDATIKDSTLRDNRSSNNGGAIYADDISVDTTLRLERTTLAQNQAASLGGGLAAFAFNDALSIILSNVTISGNRAGGNGGAISNYQFPGAIATMDVKNATIAGNRAGADGSGGGSGGGVFNSGTLRVANTIVGDNSVGASGTGPDCSGTITSQGFNLIENTSGCTVAGSTTGNQTGVDPGLAPLADNGGPTPTQALEFDSPAIDAGSPANPGSQTGCEVTDQRGVPRALDFPCDVGAYARVLCEGRVVDGVGTGDGDHLTGDAARNGILGLGGNDRLSGQDGGDGLCGGEGNDTLRGGDGNDRLNADGGNDLCIGGNGNDTGILCEERRGIEMVV